MRVLLYCRVSTEEQAISGAGLQAQRQALVAECERRGWTIVREITDEGFSAKDMRRPGVQEAIRALEAGEADALVVSKLDRLSRSMVDFSALMARAQKRGTRSSPSIVSTRRARAARRWRTCSRRSRISSAA